MTYVLHLAAHTDLPVQTVLRVLFPRFDRNRGIGAEIHRLEDRRGSSR